LGGISPRSIRCTTKLPAASPAIAAGPLSPPRSMPATLRRSRPASRSCRPWHPMQCAASRGAMSRSKRGAAPVGSEARELPATSNAASNNHHLAARGNDPAPAATLTGKCMGGPPVRPRRTGTGVLRGRTPHV